MDINTEILNYNGLVEALLDLDLKSANDNLMEVLSDPGASLDEIRDSANALVTAVAINQSRAGVALDSLGAGALSSGLVSLEELDAIWVLQIFKGRITISDIKKNTSEDTIQAVKTLLPDLIIEDHMQMYVTDVIKRFKSRVEEKARAGIVRVVSM